MAKHNNYFGDFKKALLLTLNNPTALIPLILEALISGLLFAGLGMLLTKYFTSKYGAPFTALLNGDQANALPIATLLQGTNMIIILSALLITFIIVLLINSYLETGLLGFINEMVEGAKGEKNENGIIDLTKGEQELISSYKKYSKTFSKLVAYNFTKMIISILLLIPLSTASVALYNNASSAWTISAWIISLIILVVGGVIFYLSILFLQPIMIRKKEPFMKNFKKSASLLRRKGGFVISTALTIMIAYAILSILLSSIGKALTMTTTNAAIMILFGVIKFLLETYLATTIITYLFLEYSRVDKKITAKY